MNPKKLNVGVAGCGHLGKIHCKILKEISSMDEGIIFTGIFDIDKKNAAEASKQFKVNSFNSFEELLKNIDTLIVVTPTSTHFHLAKEASGKNVNIFIEKPVTESLEEAKELIKLTANSSIKIQVGHVERFNPALISLEEYNLNPRFIEAHRLSQFNPRGTDVSVIQDLMIHDIDIILNIVDSPIEKTDANGVAIISDSIDIANARLTFANGCVANITSSRISMKKMRKMRIFQPNAYISIDFLNNESEIFRLVNSSDTFDSALSYPISNNKKLIIEKPEKINLANQSNPIKNELLFFFNSIINNGPVKVTLEDAKRAVEVSDTIIKIISKQLTRV
ncbi:MAG: Gfo/Idh/MocA family protein [Ignavibacteria bacterium]